MSSSDSGSSAVSKETISCLEDAKKGKPRKFAMICKGTAIISLVVYKKGNIESRRKEAKESGKGQFYFGSIDGKGTELRFVLARADGFENAPVKDSILKGFLDESAGMKAKPYFEIVDEPLIVLDEDDPLVARYLKLKEAANVASANHPDQAGSLQSLLQQIAIHLDRDQTVEATSGLDQLQAALANLGETPKPPSDVTVAPSNEMELFLARLKSLKGAIDQAISSGSDQSGSIKLETAEMGKFAREKDFAQANLALDRIEVLLNQLSTSSASPTSLSDTQPDPYKELYLGLLETIPGDLRRVEDINPATAATLQKVVDGAAMHAGKGDYKTAFGYLEKATQVIAKTLSESRVQDAVDVIPEGTVEAMKAALNKARSRWDAALTAARRRLEPVHDQLMQEVPSASAGLDSIIDNYENDLLADLLAGEAQANSEGLSEAIQSTLEKVQWLRTEVKNDDLFSYLESCGIAVRAAFAEAFDEVEQLLQA